MVEGRTAGRGFGAPAALLGVVLTCACAVALSWPAAGSAASAVGSAASPAVTAEVPPELAALEQQLAQLQVLSGRYAIQEELAVGLGGGAGTLPLTLIVSGTAEEDEQTHAASFELGLFGEPSVRVRTVGETEWFYDAGAKEVDGGRPWVRRHRAHSSSLAALDPTGVAQGSGTGTTSGFAQLVEELNHAEKIVDEGPLTLHGERVTEFVATLDPYPLVAQERQEAAHHESTHPLESPFGELPGGSGGGGAERFPPPSLSLEVFLAANGLPVRLRVTFEDEGQTIAFMIDTIAVNVPVSVSPPRARRTVGEAKLKRLERRAALRELKECVHVPKPVRGICRAAARQKAKHPQPEPSVT